MKPLDDYEMAIENTATLKVNTQGLVRALKDTFSNRANVLKELMQNARRAGSSSVKIVHNEKSKYLEVSDDGCSVGDFQKLLEIAASGWDAETIEREQAFGIGFASALYCAERIEVESNGRRLAANTADILSFKPVAIEACQPGRTRVALLGVKKPLSEREIESAAEGFALPVFLNGVELQRARADGAGFVDCEIGRVRLPASPSMEWMAYLQGFHVCARGHWSRENAAVFHLDPRQFAGRLPDREVLTDENEAKQRIETCLARLWTVYFVERKKAGDVDALLNNVSLLGEIGGLWLLNDIPVVPREALSAYHSAALCDSDFGLGEDVVKPMTREDAEKAVLVLDGAFDSEPLDEYTANMSERSPELVRAFNTHQYLAAKNAIGLSPSALDKGHWVYGLATLIRKFEGKVTAAAKGSPASFEAHGNCFSDTFTACDEIEFTGPLGTVRTDRGFALVPLKSGKGEALLLPQSMDATEVVTMYSSYTDENDHYQESWKSEDEETLHTEISAARTHNPSLFLQSALRNFAYGSMKTKIRGRRFEVRFNAKGDPKVVQVKRGRKRRAR